MDNGMDIPLFRGLGLQMRCLAGFAVSHAFLLEQVLPTSRLPSKFNAKQCQSKLTRFIVITSLQA